MSDLGPFSASLSGQQCVASKYPIPNKAKKNLKKAANSQKSQKYRTRLSNKYRKNSENDKFNKILDLKRKGQEGPREGRKFSKNRKSSKNFAT